MLMNNFNLDESSLPLTSVVGGGVERFGVVGLESNGVVAPDGLPEDVAAEAMLIVLLQDAARLAV